MHFKVKVLSEESDYSFDVRQKDLILHIPVFIMVLIPLLIACVMSFGIAIVVFFCVREKRQQAQQRLEEARNRIYAQNPIPTEQDRLDAILKVLDSMKHGVISQFNNKYGEDHCIICLEGFNAEEPYDENSYVHITHD